MFYVHGKAIHGNRACLVLRTQTRKGVVSSYDEFWVDCGRESAIVRYILAMNEKPWVDFDIDYQLTVHGWLPKRWTMNQRDFHKGALEYTEWIRVMRVDLDPQLSDADFQLAERPGTLIQANVYPGPQDGKPPGQAQRTYYRVGEEGRRHEITIEGGVERPSWSVWWWIIPAAFLLAGVAGYVLRRRGFLNKAAVARARGNDAK